MKNIFSKIINFFASTNKNSYQMNSENTQEYESAKIEAIKKLEELVIQTKGYSFNSLFEAWLDFSELSFFSLNHKFNTSLIYPHMKDDEEDEIEVYNIDLYEAEYIQKARDERKEEGLGGNQCFLIGGVDDSDDLIFLSNDLSKGISIIYHDDVFDSKDMDKTVDKEIAYFNCSIVELFQVMHQRSDVRFRRAYLNAMNDDK